MDITVAYFHPLLRPDVVKQDFEQIRAAGANSLLYAIHEQEEQRWPRDFERGLRLAADAGLKVHLSLGRFGNLFAGPALVPSWYTFRHPQSRVMDQHGRHHEISCFNHQAFRSWLFREIQRYISAYAIAGILLDEPRGLEVTCYCPACRALCPDVTDLARFRRRAMIEFLGEVCAFVKEVDPRVKTTIVLHPHDISLAEDLASIESLNTLGSHLFWDLLQEDITRVEEWGRALIEATRTTSKRSQLWLQNFNISERNAAEMETAFARILGLEPDEVGCYYYWRNNADPTQTWESTRRLLKRVPRRQLHWRMYSSPRLKAMTLPSRDRSENKQSATLTTLTLPLETANEESEQTAASSATIAEPSGAESELAAAPTPAIAEPIDSVESGPDDNSTTSQEED